MIDNSLRAILASVAVCGLIIIGVFWIEMEKSRCDNWLEYIKAMDYCLQYNDKCQVGPDDIAMYARSQNNIRMFCGRPD